VSPVTTAAPTTNTPFPPGTQAATVQPQPGVGQDSFQLDFARAKKAFILGQFAAAEVQLRKLWQQTTNPIDRARIEEILTACLEWNRRGATLIEQHELQGTDLLSRRTDRRTSDEIGVLYLSSIAYGLGAGLWIDILSEPNGVAGAVLPPLLFAGASAGIVGLVDSGKGLRYGAAQSTSTGMWLGFWQGFAWGTYYQAESSYQNQMSSQAYATLLFGTTTAGAITGGLIGSLTQTTPGQSAFVGSTALWPALIFGIGTAALSSDNNGSRDDHAMLAASLGLTGGTVVGALTAGTVAPTTARVRFLDIGAIAGGLALGGISLAAGGNNAKIESTLLLTDVGMIAGLGTAWWLTNDMPKDVGAQAPRSGSATIVPTVIPQRGGMGLGFAGQF